MNIARWKFHDMIDWLEEVQMWHVSEESYARIQVLNKNTIRMRIRCKRDGNHHRFSTHNHMDPGAQPQVRVVLT